MLKISMYLCMYLWACILDYSEGIRIKVSGGGMIQESASLYNSVKIL